MAIDFTANPDAEAVEGPVVLPKTPWAFCVDGTMDPDEIQAFFDSGAIPVRAVMLRVFG